jgi:pimeloyl-ACP methyl ester carboxylesterase
MKRLLLYSICLLSLTQTEAQTNVRAWNADGQVFVVWKTTTQATLSYSVHISKSDVSTISSAITVGTIFEPEWRGKRLELARAGARWSIPDGKGAIYNLAADEGLFVFTPHIEDKDVKYFFYVTKNSDSILSATNKTSDLLSIRYNPTMEPVKCHVQFNGTSGQGFPFTVFALWVDGRENPNDARPDIPIMANRAKNGAPHVFAVFTPMAGLPQGTYPAVVCLHGGGQQGSYWAYAPNSGHYKNTGNIPVNGVTIAFDDRLFLSSNGQLNEDRPTNWLGWRTNLSATNASNASVNDIVVPYTLRRLLWTIDWLRLSKLFAIDSSKISVMGNSMGGTGTLLLTRWKPERFASATAFVPPHYTPETGSRLFGTSQTNCTTTEIGPNGTNIRINDFFDPTVRISSTTRDYCLTRIFRGRCDDAAEWGDQHMKLFNDLNAKGIGMHLYWDNRDHTASDWTTNDPKTDCLDIGQWVSPVMTERCNVGYQSKYRNTISYPAFFNDDQQANKSGRQPELGNGNSTDGDAWGTWGGYYDWDVASIIDTTNRWECTIYLIGKSSISVDNYPGDSASCSVSIRRTNTFAPSPSKTLQWKLIRVNDNRILQSGNVTPNVEGLVTIDGLRIFKDPIRTRLIVETSTDTVIDCTNTTEITSNRLIANIGDAISFTVTTKDPNPSYLWQTDFGQGFLTITDRENYIGSSTQTLTISPLKFNNSNQSIRAITKSGTCIDTSNTLNVKIQDTCIERRTVYDTIRTSIAVTDTLFIDVPIAGAPSARIRLVPNQTKTRLIVSFSNINSMNGFTFSIVDAQGNEEYSTPIDKVNVLIDLAAFKENMIYSIHVTNKGGNIIANKILQLI